MKDLLPKIPHEKRVTICHNRKGYALQYDNFSNKNLCHCSCRERVPEAQEMGIFGQAVYTTKMQSVPLDRGNPNLKSILRSSQICLGIGRGCRSPAGLKDSYLLR